jgi:hypothetical protein
VSSKTNVTFVVTEGADIAAFNIISRTQLHFAISEGPDVASFNTTSINKLTFSIAEGADVADFLMKTGIELSLDAVEGADIISFRTWAGDFTLGDADYIIVPQELQMATVPFANYQTEVPPVQDQSDIKDEWQRIDIDQTRGRREE